MIFDSMKRKVALMVTLASLTLALSACSPSASVTPSPTPGNTPSEAADSTLNGGVVVGDGVTIREFSMEDETDSPMIGAGLIRKSENSFLVEAGGSSSEACLSNFTAIERNGEEFTLDHRVGNGDENIVCTMDYRFTYFLVEADEPISDDAVANIVSKGEVTNTLTFEFVAK
jgi:hypothetical protein